MSNADPYGGAYIAGVGIENDGGWTGEIFVFRLYDANGDLVIPPDELVCLGRKPLPSSIVSDLANQYWCHLKVGFEGDRITVYVNSPSTGEYAVLSVIDDVNKRDDIGFGASEAGGGNSSIRSGYKLQCLCVWWGKRVVTTHEKVLMSEIILKKRGAEKWQNLKR